MNPSLDQNNNNLKIKTASWMLFFIIKKIIKKKEGKLC